VAAKVMGLLLVMPTLGWGFPAYGSEW
jgi:hypothetical protein